MANILVSRDMPLPETERNGIFWACRVEAKSRSAEQTVNLIGISFLERFLGHSLTVGVEIEFHLLGRG